MGGSSSANFVKKTLKPFKYCKLPPVPVTIKAMEAFKINMTNQMRSMDLDYLLQLDYNPSEVGQPGYKKFKVDNKFFYAAVVEIITNPDHLARIWLLSEDNENNGRVAYFKLIGKYYDNETIEDPFVESAYTRWINTSPLPQRRPAPVPTRHYLAKA